MKIAEDVRNYAAEQGITDQAAIEEGLKQKAAEFNEAGAESGRRLNVVVSAVSADKVARYLQPGWRRSSSVSRQLRRRKREQCWTR
jgi:hypothetical protein